LKGANRIGGEWGHNPLPSPRVLENSEDERPGRPCYCGRAGCIETWLSGPGFETDYFQATGGKLSSAEIVEAAEGGEPHAPPALSRYVYRLARTPAHVLHCSDPDITVPGRGL